MLRIKLTHEANSITLSQSHYIDALLDLYSMTHCKPVATTLIPNTHLEAASDQEKVDFVKLNVISRSVIGSLNYLLFLLCQHFVSIFRVTRYTALACFSAHTQIP
ncbi:hypothetical protein O181_047296 [Austropuccinia psidii MF-1]|uniref:Reverse transcriptase Ty1/copia-type domain-containing protein n=1 Tax=Austropuccinia psidii MF-1 TaxID=1389203 RepID=A0A9Q3HJD6_9BASI|nr:hypothetical protein [Austropuccinia psidii MF-1]